MAETLLMLHGFGGTHRAWDGVIGALRRERYLPLALDLPGHGVEAAAPAPITFASCTEAVLAAAPERFALCGYSLGGRVALHAALAAPERVSALCVVAANPGIEDPAERAARRAADEVLAQKLQTGRYEDFIESWRTQPLFVSDPPAVRELARAEQRRNDPLALARAMRGLSVGAMEPLWNRLGELEMPAALVAGTRDEKFRELLSRARGLMPRAELSVLDGGHALPLENPAALAAVLERLDAEPRA